MDHEQHTGIPIRLPSQAILCVDSADSEVYDKNTGMRISAYNPANIEINNQRPLLFGYMTRIGLNEVNLQWNIPNVNATNKTFTVGLWNSSGVFQKAVRVSIPENFHTLPNIVKLLVDQLNADASGNDLSPPLGLTWTGAVGGYNVSTGPANSTRDLVNPFVALGVSGSGYFSIIPFNATTVYGAGTTPVGLPTLVDDLTNMLGLTPTALVGLPFTATIVGGYASAQYTPYVDIESNRLTKNQQVQDGSTQRYTTSSKLARVYLSKDNGAEPREFGFSYDASGNYSGSYDNAVGTGPFVLHREFKNPKIMQWNTTENVDTLDLQILDYRGNRVAIDTSITGVAGVQSQYNNTADFQFTFNATEQ